MSGVVRRIITVAKDAPAAIGAYSQAVIIDRTMYISGQLGMNPETLNLVSGGIVPETEQALKNMGAVLREAKISYSNVVKCTVMLADINDFSEMNTIYSKYFADYRPARVAFQAGALPKGARVEIEAIAMLDNITDIN